MKISTQKTQKYDALILFAFNEKNTFLASETLEKFDNENNGVIKKYLLNIDFKAKNNEIAQIAAPIDDYKSIIIIGLGKKEDITKEIIEKAAASFMKSYFNGPFENFEVITDEFAQYAKEFALGAMLAAYRFDKYKTIGKAKSQNKITEIYIEGLTNDSLEAANALYDGVAFARDLMNEPSNILNTDEFAKRLEELKNLGVEVSIIGEKQMEELGMFSFLGVGKGSPYESRLVVLNYKGGNDEKPLAFVGKGLCFDAGGISLKPAGGMEDMKGDMGGAAAVAGAIKTIAARKAKANVIGFIGLAENMPDGAAQKPGDIVKSMSGKTIEVLNTDAEGRLVLCDVLTYAQEKFAPEYIVDLATLTGAIIIALGNEYAGLFSNSDELSQKLLESGIVCGEKLWRFPMSPAYDKVLDSKIADVKNVARSGPGAGAGSITAAQFLARFINEGTKWAHLDIAGTAWKGTNDDPRDPSWATGFGVRLLDTLVSESFEK